MEIQASLDILWLLLSAVLVLMMQGAFLALESGLTRSKNAINVAMKNAADFVVSLLLWWLLAFGLMFGAGSGGLAGGSLMMPQLDAADPWLAAFFFFQAMFCATAVTIVSGAVAERMRFNGYILVTAITAGLVYPLFGHWAWGGALAGEAGWLAARGFVDFAGSTVVHGVGGWIALAAVLIIGPRSGRFDGASPRLIPGSNLPLAMLGVVLFTVGWVGFNGGSTLALSAAVPAIIANTLLAAAAGGCAAAVLTMNVAAGRIDRPAAVMFGAIAGLVAITAGCHAVSTTAALAIGAGGGVSMVGASLLLVRCRIDDALGAVPTHLAAGAWGTLAVGLFGDPTLLGTGLSREQQILAQLQGIAVCGAWSLPVAWVTLRLWNAFRPLRVSAADEEIGLNVAEHAAKTELVELLDAMSDQAQLQDLSLRVPVEPFTEVGQIAAQHNRLMDNLEAAVTQTQAIIRDINDGLFTFTADGRVSRFNPGAEKIFGRLADDVVGGAVSRLFVSPRGARMPGEAEAAAAAVVADLAGSRRRSLEARKQDSGETIWVELSVTESEELGRRFYTGLVRDVTDRRRMEEQLFRQNERLQVTLQSIADGVMTADTGGRVVYMNPVAERLTQWSLDDARGQTMHRIFPVVNRPTDAPDDSLVREVLTTEKAVVEERPKLLFGRDGTVHAIKLTAAPMRDAANQVVGAVVVFHDVTEARAMERKLSYQATHDDLTGLINRREFEGRLQDLIGEARESDKVHAVCYLDLDQFKVVNDTCGHMAGDRLLKDLASVLRNCLRVSDTLARLGGDEFGVILRGCGMKRGIAIANKLREAVRSFRFSWEGKHFSVGASLGLVELDRSTTSLGDLLSAADAACYVAKDMGRNRIHVYKPDDTRLATRQGEMNWVSRIQQALDTDGFELYYQPIAPISNASADSGHFEVLVRLRQEDGVLAPPGAFLPSAERYNLMPDIDRWVVRSTLEWLTDNLVATATPITCCSINLSGATIGDERFLSSLKQDLRRTHVPADLLCFEITETAAVADLGRATHFISELKQLGCSFALDDFGSGLSSFAYLKNLPVDYLKIDGTFIKDIDRNEIDYAMVESINRVGHVMGLLTIAEFVENEAVLADLTAIGVDFVQGYFLGRPAPLKDLAGPGDAEAAPAERRPAEAGA